MGKIIQIGGFMKSLTKRMGVLATVMAIAIVMLVGSCFAFGESAAADTGADDTYKYFSKQIEIDPIATRRFLYGSSGLVLRRIVFYFYHGR